MSLWLYILSCYAFEEKDGTNVGDAADSFGAAKEGTNSAAAAFKVVLFNLVFRETLKFLFLSSLEDLLIVSFAISVLARVFL